MTDSKLRELERRWQESRNAADEAALLLERVRVGDLDPARLKFAAFCGHEGAAVAAGEAPSDIGLEDWCARLATWGKDACIRACAFATRLLLPHWLAAVGSGSGDDPVMATTRALSEWEADGFAGSDDVIALRDRFVQEAHDYDDICFDETGAETPAAKAWEAAFFSAQVLQEPLATDHNFVPAGASEEEALATHCAYALGQLSNRPEDLAVLRQELASWALKAV